MPVQLFWRSGRDSNPRAVSAATRFPIVLVMTTSIPLQVTTSRIFCCRYSVNSECYYNRFCRIVKSKKAKKAAKNGTGKLPPRRASKAHVRTQVLHDLSHGLHGLTGCPLQVGLPFGHHSRPQGGAGHHPKAHSLEKSVLLHAFHLSFLHGQYTLFEGKKPC